MNRFHISIEKLFEGLSNYGQVYSSSASVTVLQLRLADVQIGDQFATDEEPREVLQIEFGQAVVHDDRVDAVELGRQSSGDELA